MTKLMLLLTLAAPVVAQSSGVLDDPPSAMRPGLERFAADRAALQRRYRVPMSSARSARMKTFYESWRKLLDDAPFDKLGREGKVDWLLLRNLLDHELKTLAHETTRMQEIAGLIPFRDVIVKLGEARRDMRPIDSRKAAEAVDALARAVAALPVPVGKQTHLHRAASRVAALRRELSAWYRYYAGYDPQFTWWVAKPHKAADAALKTYAAKLRGLATKGADGTLIGDPIGRAALLDELAYEMIPYTPEELVRIANREFAWCDAEMDKAATALGFKDWRAAQEHVKRLHVAPGKQPELIRAQAVEAVAFLDKRDLVTIPKLCREIWRMEMMSPARQKVSPYFLGGESIIVSFPTNTMSHKDKLMSLRGNNEHFCRAVVHHELIPGHHLQGFMTDRHRAHRGIFRTPFWVEGWALYWEMLLWDLDFARGPEDRIGMLFWRKHRCARIIFSLSFHLEKMTAPQCVDFLVERVGHERNNAEAEVRRSVGGAYGPLYQAAYMLGGLQIRRLHKELVKSGKMTARAFHDAILKRNAIPIELVRAGLQGDVKLTRDFKPRWRFYD